MLSMNFVLILASLCHCALSYPNYEGQATHNFIADHQTFYFTSNAFSNATTSNKKCEVPAGYQLYVGFGAYKYHDERHTDWDTARKACIAEGAHLAVPRSKAEEAILKDYIGSQVVRWAWVGYHSHFDRSEFYSVLDEPIDDGTRIHIPESRKSMDDRCVVIAYRQGLMRWTCKAPENFFCKIDCEEY
ncbi:uncharacterized protein LOC100120824 isoform X2 [Nasonia vitripennis]|uniref:C-type lectin domain-containing protein n=1 Tax=Nasonia vitripennis TaxID=7425 RepID=A0A7M7GHD2_NASVI|nr:uncharacterized protein LOC100120824 isoform X2 [Nasonia vitripennis]